LNLIKSGIRQAQGETKRKVQNSVFRPPCWWDEELRVGPPHFRLVLAALLSELWSPPLVVRGLLRGFLFSGTSPALIFKEVEKRRWNCSPFAPSTLPLFITIYLARFPPLSLSLRDATKHLFDDNENCKIAFKIFNLYC
jgi:hypothetical protein